MLTSSTSARSTMNLLLRVGGVVVGSGEATGISNVAGTLELVERAGTAGKWSKYAAMRSKGDAC